MGSIATNHAKSRDGDITIVAVILCEEVTVTEQPAGFAAGARLNRPCFGKSLRGRHLDEGVADANVLRITADLLFRQLDLKTGLASQTTERWPHH
jgi:hypothetical protein